MTTTQLPQMTTQHAADLVDFTENHGFKIAEDIVRHQIWPNVIAFMDDRGSLLDGIRLQVELLNTAGVIDKAEMKLAQFKNPGMAAAARVVLDDVKPLVLKRDIFANAVEKDIAQQVYVTHLFLLLFTARELTCSTEQLAEVNEGELFDTFQEEAARLVRMVQVALQKERQA